VTRDGSAGNVRNVSTARAQRTGTRAPTSTQIGVLLREWRQRRRLSQLDLALDTGISARHLSFLETGRSKPSAEMVLRLAEVLDVPLRDRNGLLLAAGFAPVFPERELDDPELTPVRAALDLILGGHDPNPAIVVDRGWEVVATNTGFGLLVDGVAPELLAPPVNAMRLALHPDGLAARVANPGVWRAHLLDRVGRQVARTGNPAVAALYDELAALPGPAPEHVPDLDGTGNVFVPLQLLHGGELLTFFSTVSTFGTAVDITVAELSIESFFPADETTARSVRDYAAAAQAGGAAAQ